MTADLTGSNADLAAWVTECDMTHFRSLIVSDLSDLLLLQDTGGAPLARRWVKIPENILAFLTTELD